MIDGGVRLEGLEGSEGSPMAAGGSCARQRSSTVFIFFEVGSMRW